MTYSTCYVDVLKDAAVERIPDFGVRRETLIPKLIRPPGCTHYWLPDVKDWAKTHDKPIHYIDNCWIEVELSVEELRCFLRDVCPNNILEDPAQGRGLSGRDRYVVIAEEF